MALKTFSLDSSGPAGGSDSPSGFVVTDLDDAQAATGIVRTAKKVLVDGALTLARSETYAWALIGEQISGASAGINALPDRYAGAVEQFTASMSAEPGPTRLSLRPGRGVSYEDLFDTDAVDAADAAEGEATESAASVRLRDTSLLAHGVAAAAAAALGGVHGRHITIESAQPATAAIAALLIEQGASVTEAASTDFVSSGADALICGSRAGLIDHELAAALPHAHIVPMGPVPLTARALAVARRRSITVIADFLSTCGPLFAQRHPGETRGISPADLAALAVDVELFVKDRSNEFVTHTDGPFMAACHAAEYFLETWLEELPFGRPLA